MLLQIIRKKRIGSLSRWGGMPATTGVICQIKAVGNLTE